ARIAWDGSFDLSEAIEGIYDSMGRKVEGKERIKVIVGGKADAQIEWECEGVPSGIYFIVVRWESGNESIPIVVE
ncbi:MAG: hypothetical protein N2517_08705, partial [Ignavibacteria bacterium]|nr:hypothetical protein [Ignavibacteria bacterium]